MELARRLKMSNGIVSVYFSMWELVENSTNEFVYILTHKIVEAYKEILGLRYKIKNALLLPVSTIISILKTTDLKIKIFDEIEIALSRREDKKELIAELIKKAFLLPEELAKKTNTRCIFIIDEFPSIMELKNGRALGTGIIKVIRTINETYRYTILNISGSIRKTMETTILSPLSPFYRQFIIKNVTPFEEKDVHVLLKTNLRGQISHEVTNHIYSETKGFLFIYSLLEENYFK